ncbi:hypothetical protein C8R45DRAFT_921943 [Mycena sanguinolenta]|nr:hypothetical protein C8R45DRAFT_921943 [Mycena sanguinolenta]
MSSGAASPQRPLCVSVLQARDLDRWCLGSGQISQDIFGELDEFTGITLDLALLVYVLGHVLLAHVLPDRPIHPPLVPVYLRLILLTIFIPAIHSRIFYWVTVRRLCLSFHGSKIKDHENNFMFGLPEHKLMGSTRKNGQNSWKYWVGCLNMNTIPKS